MITLTKLIDGELTARMPDGSRTYVSTARSICESGYADSMVVVSAPAYGMHPKRRGYAVAEPIQADEAAYCVNPRGLLYMGLR